MAAETDRLRVRPLSNVGLEKRRSNVVPIVRLAGAGIGRRQLLPRVILPSFVCLVYWPPRCAPCSVGPSHGLTVGVEEAIGLQGCPYVDRKGETIPGSPHPTTRIPRDDACGSFGEGCVIAVIALHNQPATSVAQSSGQARPTVGMSSHLVAVLVVVRVKVSAPSITCTLMGLSV